MPARQSSTLPNNSSNAMGNQVGNAIASQSGNFPPHCRPAIRDTLGIERRFVGAGWAETRPMERRACRVPILKCTRRVV